MSDIRAAAPPGSGGDDERTRWEDRYLAKESADPAATADPPVPPEPLARMASLVPPGGRAIDIAGGDGGGGLFLAARGLETTVVDISTVALRRAARFAETAELELGTAALDLADTGLAAILAAVGGPDPVIITCCHYLNRTLLSSVAQDLPSGARFMVAIATTVDLRPDDRRSSRFLLEPGELVGLVLGPAEDRLRVLHRREGLAFGRHRAELVVEASGPGSAR